MKKYKTTTIKMSRAAVMVSALRVNINPADICTVRITLFGGNHVYVYVDRHSFSHVHVALKPKDPNASQREIIYEDQTIRYRIYATYLDTLTSLPYLS